MSTTVHPLTMDQAHEEFSSLVDKILAYEQTMSETEPASSCTFTQATIFQALKSTFSDQNVVWQAVLSCGGE